jgi:hypothetical protein
MEQNGNHFQSTRELAPLNTIRLLLVSFINAYKCSKNFLKFRIHMKCCIGYNVWIIWVAPQNRELASENSADEERHTALHTPWRRFDIWGSLGLSCLHQNCTGNKTWRQGVGCYFPRIALSQNSEIICYTWLLRSQNSEMIRYTWMLRKSVSTPWRYRWGVEVYLHSFFTSLLNGG